MKKTMMLMFALMIGLSFASMTFAEEKKAETKTEKKTETKTEKKTEKTEKSEKK